MPVKALTIVVTSFNPVKIEAAREAFGNRFPLHDIRVIPVQVDSGVADQPMSDDETRQGARNRVAEARLKKPDADYWVGMEGGLDFFDQHLMAFAWMVVTGPDNRSSEARSATLPLPPKVQTLVESGLELGEANDRVFFNAEQQAGRWRLWFTDRWPDDT